jgi:predicted phosphodiesterase
MAAVKIGVVGDLSFGDPSRLSAVLDAALIACDYVVQVGDLHPAYPQVTSRYATSGHKLFPIPGNHDTDYDSIGCPRVWRLDIQYPSVTLLGLDNSAGTLSPQSKALFGAAKSAQFEFTFAHMPPCELVLPDGSTNGHNMAEAGGGDDAAWLRDQLKVRADAMCCGHYHSWTYQQSSFGPVIVDGRGGAAPELAYTLITVTDDGWVLHSVGVG